MYLHIKKILLLCLIFKGLLYGEVKPEKVEQWLNVPSMKQVAIKEIGKNKYKEFIPRLIKISENSREDIKLRIDAIKSLRVFKDDKTVILSLLNGLSEDNDLPIRMNCASALGDIGSNDILVLSKLVKIFDEYPEPKLFKEVISTLEKIGDKRVQYILSDVVMFCEDLAVKRRALKAIEKIGDKMVVKELRESVEIFKKEKTVKGEIMPDIKKAIEILSKK